MDYITLHFSPVSALFVLHTSGVEMIQKKNFVRANQTKATWRIDHELQLAAAAAVDENNHQHSQNVRRCSLMGLLKLALWI
jgi:hypothetical protein